MRHIVSGFIIASAILCARFSSASESPAAEQTITVQIHDYSRVPAESLSSAIGMVTRMYEGIGVRIKWKGMIRWEGRQPKYEREDESHEAAQVTVIILNAKMALRGQVAPDVLGFAAVPEEGMGSIAYAIYPRVRSIALEMPASEGTLLGFVMAHEIGHLMLPRRSHSETGLMHSNWDIRELSRVDLQKLQFSEQQADRIRRTIEDDSRALASAGRR